MIPFLILYTSLCLVAAWWVAKGGRSFWNVFIIGFLVTPIVTLISLWSAQKSSLLK
jgi:hypothetical protein